MKNSGRSATEDTQVKVLFLKLANVNSWKKNVNDEKEEIFIFYPLVRTSATEMFEFCTVITFHSHYERKIMFHALNINVFYILILHLIVTFYCK